METKDNQISYHKFVYHSIMVVFLAVGRKGRLDQGHRTEYVHCGWNSLLHLVFMDFRVHADFGPSQRSQTDQ
jgi:hypothetical protein